MGHHPLRTWLQKPSKKISISNQTIKKKNSIPLTSRITSGNERLLQYLEIILIYHANHKDEKKNHNNQHKKASDKIQHPIVIKLSQTKNIRELIKYSPLWSRTRQRGLVSPRLFNTFENQPVQWSKEKKRI